jgi:hypothetical protein
MQGDLPLHFTHPLGSSIHTRVTVKMHNILGVQV